MTQSEFKQVILRLSPDLAKVIEVGGWPRLSFAIVCGNVAQDLWINNPTLDNADTQALRHQLQHLEKKGHFDFTEWEE